MPPPHTFALVALLLLLLLASGIHAHKMRLLKFDQHAINVGRVAPRPWTVDDNATNVHCYRHVLEQADAQALNEAPTPGFYTFRLPVSGAEHERHVRRRLFYAEIEQVEWGAVLEDRCVGGDASNHSDYRLHEDAALFFWDATGMWGTFARLPVPCAIARTQRYGLASNSPLDWGSRAMVRDDARVYAPQHGYRAMDTLWNDNDQGGIVPADDEHYFTLTMRYQSTSVYPLQRLVVRKCVALISDVDSEQQQTAATAATDEFDALDEQAAWRIGRRSADDSSVLTMRAAPPRVLLLRSRVVRESDATCSVWLGYAFAPSAALGDTHTLDTHTLGNRMSHSAPSNVRPVRVLESGVHRNEFHVRWVCEGKLNHGFQPLAWNVAGAQQHLVIMHVDTDAVGEALVSAAIRRVTLAESSPTQLQYILEAHTGRHARPLAARPLRPAQVGLARNFDEQETASIVKFALIAIVWLAGLYGFLFWLTGGPVVANWVIIIIVLFITGVISLNTFTTNNDFTDPSQRPLEYDIQDAEQKYGVDLPAPYTPTPV